MCEWPINMKRFSVSLIFGEMQIKTTIRWHYMGTRIANTKWADYNKCWLRCVEQLELLHIAYENIKWYRGFGKQFRGFL